MVINKTLLFWVCVQSVFRVNFSFSCCRQLLFCRVTLGKSFLQFSAMKMAHSPPGHHSVTGRPSVNGLALAEYVIYRGEQVLTLLGFVCLQQYVALTRIGHVALNGFGWEEGNFRLGNLQIKCLA